MKNLILASSVCFSFLLSFKVYSAELFVLKNQNLNDIQKEAISLYFKKVSEVTPSIIKETLKTPIEVSFENFKESPQLSSLPADKCNMSINLIYGKTNSLSSNHIILNQLLLLEIIKGEEDATSFDCGHKNYYRLAMATLLHETSHIYDHIHFGSTQVSGLKSFFKLSDWKRNLLYQGSSKNLSQKRSIDPYEYKSLEEHYAVNFEYFILDSEYKCKRPSYYLYFQEQFKTSPHADSLCKINTQVRLDDTKNIINIDPERVYRVDYLLASKGDEAISGFGHSMYRLIVCAPFRKTVSAECLKDKLYHVVLSYRANVTDIKSNPLKGLVGKYDSILFMLSFPKVIEEYNMSELRDLYSLPLNFSKEQKRRFIYKTLETYWEYSGSYKFLTSNCASESFDLLQGAINKHPIINESAVKPYSLMDILVKYRIADKDVFKDLEVARKNGLLFESDANRLDQIKVSLFGVEESDFESSNINSWTGKSIMGKKKKHIKDILQSLSPDQFQEKLQQLKNEEQTLVTKNRLNDLSIIAQAALSIGQHDLDEEIGDYLEKLENDPGPLGQSVRNWNEKRKNFRLSPLKDDYGIPLEISEQDFEAYKNLMDILEQTETDLVNDVKDRYTEKVGNLMDLKKVIEEARTKSKIIGIDLYLKK
ncbi:MAG: DUF4105 domain-containing protein [Bacteriovorax sp.]|nr:DUF4105 domain-containing protein [Bacteriovorax sp.]